MQQKKHCKKITTDKTKPSYLRAVFVARNDGLCFGNSVLQPSLPPSISYNTNMELSNTYIELEAMIERYWRLKSLHEIVQMLEKAENEGQINALERDLLIELYIAKHSDLD